MVQTIHNDRSLLPSGVWGTKLTGTARPSSSGPTALSGHTVAPASSTSIPGPVGGIVQGARTLVGRSAAAPALQPGNPVGNAVLRGANELNRLINRIEATRGRSGTLSALGEKALGQLDRIAEACSLVAGGPATGEALQTQLDKLKALLEGSEHALQPETLSDGLQDLLGAKSGKNDDLELESCIGTIAAWTQEVTDQAQDRIKYLAQSLGSSPQSLSSLYETKSRINAAAVAILDEAIGPEDSGRPRRAPESLAVLRQARNYFEIRKQQLQGLSERARGEIGDLREVAGTTKLTGLSRLLHPFKARAESAARASYVKDILADKNIPAQTPDTNEQSVVEDALAQFLKQAKVVDLNPNRTVEHAFVRLREADPAWSTPVRTEIHLPVIPAMNTPGGNDASVRELLHKNPQMVGEMRRRGESASIETAHLANPAPDTSSFSVRTRIAHSEISPAPVFFPSYNGEGVSSHRATEARHAVNLAQTTLRDSRDPEKPLFSGVRHGAISAFGITGEGVARMSEEELRPLVRDLLLPDEWRKDVQTKMPDFDTTVRAIRGGLEPALVDTMRARANENRAKEIVALTVMTDPELLEAALRGGEPPPTVNLLSLSLLTPDSFRRGLDDNESLMLKDQAAAWEAVSGEQEISIPHPENDRSSIKVKVNVNPIAMNYGVNQGALKGIAGLHTDAISGWHVSDALNASGLKELFGTASPEEIRNSRVGLLGERIAALEDRNFKQVAEAMSAFPRVHNEDREAAGLLRIDGPSDRIDGLSNQRPTADQLVEQAKTHLAVIDDQSTPLGAALELIRQIAAIQSEGSYRKAGTEPYKMPVRVAVLAELLGVKVAFNCTNGTGRTGELDAEIKHFKLQMALTGKVPPPDRERTPEEQRHFHEVLTNSGNFEMQRLNTG